jgi:hypothetical protein
MNMTLTRWCAAGLIACCGAFAQAAPPMSEADVRAVRDVVQAQLKAMAEGDGERAFSYAAPGIRGQFGSAATFMAMVQQGYPMVIRPASVSFFRPEALNDAVLQPVQLRAPDGRVWLVAYQLQRQPDGRWRISACVVRPDSGRPAT